MVITGGGQTSKFTPEDAFSALESLRQGVVLRDGQLAVAFINSAARQILGITSGTEIEPEALKSWQILDEFDNPVHLPLQAVVSEGRSWHGVLFRIVRPGHSDQWLESEARPFVLSGGEVGALSIFTDITASHALRLRAEERERYFRAIADNVNDVMWRNDAHGNAVWISPSVARILGYDVEELMGTAFLDLVHPDDRADASTRRADAARGSQVSGRGRFRRKDGSWCSMSVRASPFVDASGKAEGTFATARDVSVEQEALIALADSEERYRLLSQVSDAMAGETAPAAICEIAAGFLAGALGDAGAVLLFNEARDSLIPLGVAHHDPKSEEVLRGAVGAEELPLVDGLAKTVADGHESIVVSGEELFTTTPAVAARFNEYLARLGIASALVSPLRVGADVIGLIALGRDAGSSVFSPRDQALVDELAWRIAAFIHQAHLAATVVEAERSYRLIAESASDVVVQLSLDGRIEWVSPSVLPTLGWSREEFESMGSADVTHPDDADHAVALLQDLMSDVGTHNRVRIRCKNGSYVWFDATLRLLTDDLGAASGVIAGLRNIEAEVQTTAALEQSEATFRLAMANAPIGMAIVGLDGTFWEVNEALCKIVDIDREILLSKTVEQLTYEPDVLPYESQLQRLLGDEIPNYHLEKRYRRNDGTPVWVDVQVSLVRDADGDPKFFVKQIVNIDDVRKVRRALEFRARHDALTGALDRAALLDELDDMMGPGGFDNVAILYCDIDDFKGVNDTYGHDVGDLVLQAVTDRIRGRARRSDVVARIGGDEFVVVVPDVALAAEASEFAEAIRRSVAQPIQADDVTLSITMSIGVAMKLPTEDATELLARSDEAMYQAKNAGRDRVAVARATAG